MSGVAEEIKAEARIQGWSEKENWKGKPEDWVDADVFVQRGKEWVGSLKKSNDALHRELQATKQQLDSIRKTTDEFKRFQKEAYERKIQEYQDQIDSLKEERAKAIADGDGKRVNELDDTLDQVKDSVRETKKQAEDVSKAQPEPTTTQVDPALQSWLENNDWFGKNTRLTSIANGIGESLRLEFPLLKGKDFLDKLDEVLQEEFPEKFGGTSKTRATNTVESGSGTRQGGRRNANAKSYDNLPDDAKAACDRFVKQKLMTREEYVSSYDWSN